MKEIYSKLTNDKVLKLTTNKIGLHILIFEGSNRLGIQMHLDETLALIKELQNVYDIVKEKETLVYKGLSW